MILFLLFLHIFSSIEFRFNFRSTFVYFVVADPLSERLLFSTRKKFHPALFGIEFQFFNSSNVDKSVY